MIFAPDLAQKILSGEKTITRRPVKFLYPDAPKPCRYKEGSTYAVQPGRGKKSIGRIRIDTVEMEPLDGVFYGSEAVQEGFENPFDFVERWREMYGSFDNNQAVWRIAFELVTPEKGTPNA